MLPVYATCLRGEGYGIIGMIDVVLSLMIVLIGYGVQGSMSRFYFQYSTGKNRNTLVSTAVLLMIVMLVCITIPVLIFSDQVAWLTFGREEYGHYIFLAILTFIATMSSSNAEIFILIQQKSILYSLISLSKLVIGLSLNIYLIVYLKLGILGYLYSGLITGVIFTSFIHGYVFFNVGLRFKKEIALEILKFSLPLLPGYIAIFIRNNTDRVLLRTFMGLTQVGAFEMLFKFATLLGFLIVEPFSKIWGIKRFEIADNSDGPMTMGTVYTLQLALMLFFGLVLSLEIPIILRILTPEEFWLSGNIAVLAVLSRILNASFYQFHFGLLYSKKTKIISYIQICTTIVSFLLALILIKPFGILGAVIVSALTNTFQCIIGLYYGNLNYKILYEWKRIAGMFVFAGLLFYLNNKISFSGSEIISQWLNAIVTQPLDSFMNFFQLDRFRDGKLVSYVLKNIPLLTEGSIKLFLSCIFIVGLIFVDIIPKQKILGILRTKSFKPILVTKQE